MEEQNMTIRGAREKDIEKVEDIYRHIHEAERQGYVEIGWDPNIYPIRQTAIEAIQRGDLYVMEREGEIVASAIINQIQPPGYAQGRWGYEVKDEEVMVIHTLVVEPKQKGRGFGKAFIAYYERTAKERGCKILRLDTQAKNATAKAMYSKLGYRVADTVRCNFNGIDVDQLILFDKRIDM